MTDQSTPPNPGDLGLQRPHPARLYDYFLGGKTNYAVDRQAAAASLQVYPNAMVAARQNRAFMHRAVRYLAREHGIRQFIDIGTGVPTEPNLHQVAQHELPDARVVYTDNDPIVLTYARALLNGTEEGATAYVPADVREPASILEHAQRIVDFTQPVALSLIAVLHFVDDESDPHALTRTLLDPLPSGSALALTHATCDLDPDMQLLADTYTARGMICRPRPKSEVERFFADLRTVPPGVVATCDWRPELESDGMAQLPGMVASTEVGVWGGVALKP
ncbi:SAM-dependent methyltransferase [Streptomyces sp. AJS327]|uniref:SAM-dependent methyltransferase n=1 Tax=Streptomyces sp. AJS327 TaxID=2545265 RepID=UPI0015DED434|nr:SAM-dependent methyltransferase [Streptomyces sp. AJS327]MBA0053385.1 SAM-dependent methyltransferase [Streptomyces sp. AJS327]